MKIALLIQGLNIQGGTQHQLLELAHYLKKKNHEVTIYTQSLDEDKCYPELLDGLQVISLKKRSHKKINTIIRSNTVSKNKIGKIFSFLINILSKINAIRISFLIKKNTDIINPHHTGILESAWLFKVFYPKTRINWFCNEIPVGESNYLNFIGKNEKFSLSNILIFLQLKYYKILLQKVDSVAVNDNRNKKLLKEIFNKDSVNVGTGMNIDKFSFSKNIFKKNDEIKIISVGLLFPYRRYEDLIRAVSLASKKGTNTSLKIIGNPILSPDYKKKLYSVARKEKIFDNIIFIDSVKEREIIKLYQESDIFVWSCDRNTYGLAVIEAMSCGLTSIVSDTTGVAEILEDNKTALIIPPRDPNLLADKIIYLANNPEKREEIGRNARKFIEDNLTWDHFGKKMEELFYSDFSNGKK